MKVAYIAGPYRATSERKLVLNIRAAETIAIELWKMGFVAYCPHMNTAHFGGLLPDIVWLNGGLEMVRRCDCLITAPGWRYSAGAAVEHDRACEWNIPIFHWPHDINAVDQFAHEGINT